MLPITRFSLQNFCRVCLCELSTAKEPSRNVTGVSLNKIFPQSICNSCHLKVIALKEFQRKTIFSIGILRLIIDDDKSRLATEAPFKRLLKFCRVCLRRQSNECHNIRKCRELCRGMSECTGIQLIGSYEHEPMQAEDAIKDDLRFPESLCNRCYAALKSFMQFKLVSKQTADYLKNVLNENEDIDVVEDTLEGTEEHLDLEALQLTELLPVAEPCKLHSVGSDSDNDRVRSILEIKACKDELTSINLRNTETEINGNITSTDDSDTLDKLVIKSNGEYNSVGENKPIKQRFLQSLKANLKCHTCNKSFRKQYLYEAHVKSMHEGIENAFACPQCSKSHTNLKALQRHISTSHIKQNANYFCKYCERSFKRNVRLKEHISTVHQKLKPFNCSICDKAFGTKNTLIRHEKNHSTEKRFSCEYCGKRYNSKSDLNVHIQRHTANPDLLCPICKRAQADKEELTKHIGRHSKTYQCTTCGKIFKKMVNLREHVDTVHLKQKFNCRFCSLAFSARKSLKNHELCHNSTNWPEVCLECKLYFKSKHSFLIHIKKSHSKPLKLKTDHCEKCILCQCRFDTKDSLQQHMEKFHAFDVKRIEPHKLKFEEFEEKISIKA